MKRILVTGATGFVGRACIEPLRENGYSVHTISTGRRKISESCTDWHGSLLDTEHLPALIHAISPSHLLHLAWDVSHGSYWTTPTNIEWLAAGELLLRAFFASGGRRAVGLGTCAEYGWTIDQYSERAAPLNPATCYGKSKLALCRIFEAAGEHGASTAWARLFFPFGPGEQPGRLLPSVITTLLAGRPADCTLGTQMRDYIYIDDVGRALAALVDSDVTGAINIGSGIGILLRDLIMGAARQVGRPDLVRLGALPMRPGDPRSLVADTTRLMREVGFAPEVPMDEAIRRTVSYWTDQSESAGI